MVGIARQKNELKGLTERLDKITKAYKMQIGPEKTKVMTNNPGHSELDIGVNCFRLETVNSLKKLGTIMSDEGSKPEILGQLR